MPEVFWSVSLLTWHFLLWGHSKVHAITLLHSWRLCHILKRPVLCGICLSQEYWSSRSQCWRLEAPNAIRDTSLKTFFELQNNSYSVSLRSFWHSKGRHRGKLHFHCFFSSSFSPFLFTFVSNILPNKESVLILWKCISVGTLKKPSWQI